MPWNVTGFRAGAVPGDAVGSTAPQPCSPTGWWELHPRETPAWVDVLGPWAAAGSGSPRCPRLMET